MANKLTPEEAIEVINKELKRCHLEYQTILNFFSRVVHLYTSCHMDREHQYHDNWLDYEEITRVKYIKSNASLIESAINQFEPTVHDINKIVQSSHLTPYAWRMISGVLQKLEELTTVVNKRRELGWGEIGLSGRRCRYFADQSYSLRGFLENEIRCIKDDNASDNPGARRSNPQPYEQGLRELEIVDKLVKQVAAEIVALQAICKQFAK